MKCTILALRDMAQVANSMVLASIKYFGFEGQIHGDALISVMCLECFTVHDVVEGNTDAFELAKNAYIGEFVKAALEAFDVLDLLNGECIRCRDLTVYLFSKKSGELGVALTFPCRNHHSPAQNAHAYPSLL
jgi:hypothetical protein